MELEARWNNQSLIVSSNKNGNALSLSCSLKTPCDFILEHTTWNSLRSLCGFSFSDLLNLGSKWIKLDFSLKGTSKSRQVMQRGYWFVGKATNSLIVHSCGIDSNDTSFYAVSLSFSVIGSCGYMYFLYLVCFLKLFVVFSISGS